MKFFEGILLEADAEDIRFQLKSEDVDGERTVTFYTLTGSAATDPSSGSKLMLKIEVKNTSLI